MPDTCIISERAAKDLVVSTPSVENLRQWSRLYSASSHLAGDQAHASSIQALWASYGIPTTLSSHRTLLNYPGPNSAVRLIHPKDSSCLFEASLVEDVLAEDPTSSIGPPAFHGYSYPGRVRSKLVYANFGRPEDFKFLQTNGISVQGRIILCKYSINLRGLKVKAAQQAGAVGVLLYNDPQEDSDLTTENGYLPYPDGPARHPSAIQRGSVSYFSVALGQCSTSTSTPQIPSLPISYRDARRLLEALEGYGLRKQALPADWQGVLPGLEYCSGPTALTVELVNDVQYRETDIHNVIGSIEGESTECIILGNHHDSWTSGAVDPVSGSAAMNEVVRSFGKLLQSGWKPYRKIILASWDNEEYGLIGSAAWATKNTKYLTKNCVAYINVNESTNGGQILGTVGSPLLSNVLYQASKGVPSPLSDPLLENLDWILVDKDGEPSVFLDWLQETKNHDPSADTPAIDPIGTGSDYTVFQHHLGIPSMDLMFNRSKRSAVYQYHSKYDSFLWMEKFGDPGFRKHRAMAQLWGLLAVRLATDPVLDFAAGSYATRLEKEARSLKLPHTVTLNWLLQAIRAFQHEADKLDSQAKTVREALQSKTGDHQSLRDEIRAINQRYKSIEAGFLNPGGLPLRPWYRHLAFGPGLWKGYDGVAFPAIADALLTRNDATVAAAVDITTAAVNRVAGLIAPNK